MAPSGSQTYGVLNGGGSTISRQFSFTASGSCGGTVLATLQLTDGTYVVGNIVYTIPLGRPVTPFSQNFDGVTPPALPAGWSNAVSGGGLNWGASTTLRDSSPNAASVTGTTNRGLSELYSPVIPIASSSAQLLFKQNFNTETDPVDVSRCYDGGVLEISINNGPFADILSAGGSFVSGGYTKTISTTNDNPLVGRLAWGGVSSNFITTVINLPAAAAGNNVSFKWRFGTDTGNYFGQSAWYIDTISVNDGFTCCSSTADIAVMQTPSTIFVYLGQNLDCLISVTNSGSQSVSSVTVTDAIPANASFSTSSSGCIFTNGLLICSIGAMNPGDSNGVLVTFTPLVTGLFTNIVSVGANLPDPVPSNNWSTNVTLVDTNLAAPSITTSPTNMTVLAGASASLLVSASGEPPPTYQWLFYGTNLPGATSALLLIPNAQAANIGDYFAIASNSLGSATSSIAHLKVLVAPVIQSSGFGPGGTNFGVTVQTVSGQSYLLQYKNSLTDSAWTPLPPPVSGSGAPITLHDTNTPPALNRFYRVSSF
jgi:uncharacterized repeat protein (TIGR01451 family)